MKMMSISGLVCYVKDIATTADFYKKLGFTFTTHKPDHLATELGGFWIDFHPQDKEDKPDFQREARFEPKGAGLFIYVNVDNVDEFYHDLLTKDITPSSEPRDWPWGNREFVVRDPDGYKLVFFKKL